MVEIVLDENVSLSLATSLRERGHKVWAVAETNRRGISDNLVWEEARKKQAVLITRDYHFTNSSRFHPGEVFAVIYIRQGNLTAVQEVRLVQSFLAANATDLFHNRLITLSIFSVTMR